MPQTWLVVQCFTCRAYQVDQEKKASKWSCKLCGAKQSLQRVFARSHKAADCRHVVQQYNTARGAVEQEDTERALREAEAGWDDAAAEGGWVGDEGGHGWEQQPGQQAAGARWQQFQEEEGAEGEVVEGCTLALPERAVAGKQKRGGGQAGGGKRQRQQQPVSHETEPDGGDAWGAPPPQHQQPQQPMQLRPQQRPLGSQNSAARPSGQPGWQWPPPLQQHPTCSPGGALAGASWQQPSQRQPPLQPQQPGRQAAAPGGRWDGSGATPAAASNSKWGGFAFEEEDW